MRTVSASLLLLAACGEESETGPCMLDQPYKWGGATPPYKESFRALSIDGTAQDRDTNCKATVDFGECRGGKWADVGDLMGALARPGVVSAWELDADAPDDPYLFIERADGARVYLPSRCDSEKPCDTTPKDLRTLRDVLTRMSGQFPECDDGG